MSSVITYEGLDWLLGVAFKGQPQLATLYLGLFTSQTPTTVPAQTATGGATPSGWAEVAASGGSGYARVAIEANEWGDPSTVNSVGRMITAAAQEYAAATANWAAANGFFIATKASSQAGDVVILFANFDDGVESLIRAGDIQRVTPAIELDGVVA